MGLAARWTRYWMRHASLGRFGRFAMRCAAWPEPPHKARVRLAALNPVGFVASSATIHHRNADFGAGVFIDEGVIIFERNDGGAVRFGDQVRIYRDTIIETGFGANLIIGRGSSIHPRCQINAYVESIEIGADVMIAPNCGLYSYDHGIVSGRAISDQPLTSKGPIRIGDGSWIGFGSIILSGVAIGDGAAIGAGSVVTRDIPAGAIALGNPAKVIRMRDTL